MSESKKRVRRTNETMVVKCGVMCFDGTHLTSCAINFFGGASIYISKHKPTDTHFVSRLYAIAAHSLSRFAWLDGRSCVSLYAAVNSLVYSSLLRSCLHKILTAFICMRFVSPSSYFCVVLNQQNRSTLPFKTFKSIFLLCFQSFRSIRFFLFFAELWKLNR